MTEDEEMKKLFDSPLSLEWIKKTFPGTNTYWSKDGKKITNIAYMWNHQFYIDEENWDSFEDFEKYGQMFLKVKIKNLKNTAIVKYKGK